MGKTSIEWTGRTWNIVDGCSVVSPGCINCYAKGIAARFSGPGKPYHRLAIMTEHGPQWTGEVRFVDKRLADPMRWKKPTRVFVNSMSDLFHEGFSNEQIAAAFGVMAACPQHTFQVLTKRADRMRKFFFWVQAESDRSRYAGAMGDSPAEVCRGAAITYFRKPDGSMPHGPGRKLFGYDDRWPLPNVWLGVSVEDQKRADERILDLCATPAAIRFISYEPALGPVDFGLFGVLPNTICPTMTWTHQLIHWIIVGGESGHGARPFDPQWARNTIRQCKEAGVACFFKQMGSKPMIASYPVRGITKKGGDPSEWPEDLRVREFPQERMAQ